MSRPPRVVKLLVVAWGILAIAAIALLVASMFLGETLVVPASLCALAAQVVVLGMAILLLWR